ncbi:MAG: PLP-dependent transferase [Lentisphaeria bacterium]|nr:PLP-dependent transferase [Lentisphaeria bacterium]NQZ69463.1 PLP-dependent transferase [Lentisphaeria bacterium]
MTNNFYHAKRLSPLRKTSTALTVDELVDEQLKHFSIDLKSEMGESLKELCGYIYQTNMSLHQLWQTSTDFLVNLDRKDRIAYFNAKRFICFQLAKILDELQVPLRKSYQSVVTQQTTHYSKGPYPLFDNITAIFSANPVITKTATYLYACTEWIDDAFQGKEPMLEIYSRLMNPTSIALANHIVDIEAGPLASDYLAWNFNSGMAAIDALFSHLIGYQDIVISSRNIYGGTYQLLHDWYAKKSNLNISLEWYDGYCVEKFQTCLDNCLANHEEALKQGRKIYVFLESPANPHGYVIDVAGISRVAHNHGLTVICDSTIATPFLHATLKARDPLERPDYVIHSYTKDLVGTGTTTAGVVIGRNERMFLPKGEQITITNYLGEDEIINWDQTLFWNVYYIKGSFLDSTKAFEVLNGIRTLDMRMLNKCINTAVLATVLDHHPSINVHCSILERSDNHEIAQKTLFLGLAAPLFTIDFENDTNPIKSEIFKRFFDSLEPAFGLQVSLGQVNTVILCPAFTSHSELSDDALKDAGIAPTTIRISVGDEDPRVLIAHFIKAAALTFDPVQADFSELFMSPEEIDQLYKHYYLDTHKKYINSKDGMATALT